MHNIANFCALQQQLKNEVKQSKEERDEARSAKKATQELLIESMEKSALEAVCVQHNGEAVFARLSEPAKKYKRLRDEDDILPLFHDLRDYLRTNADQGAMVDLTYKLFLERATEATSAPRKTLRLTKRVPADTSVAYEGEAVRLASSYAQSCSVAREISDRCKPLRQTIRRAEKELVPAVKAMPEPPKVVARDQDGVERGVVTVEAKVPTARRCLGARRVGQIVKAAALLALPSGDEQSVEAFERTFRQQLRSMIRSSQETLAKQTADATRLVVKQNR